MLSQIYPDADSAPRAVRGYSHLRMTGSVTG